MSIWLHSICWPHQWVLCIIKEVFPPHIWFSTCQSLLHAPVLSVYWNPNMWAVWGRDMGIPPWQPSPCRPHAFSAAWTALVTSPLPSKSHWMNLAAHPVSGVQHIRLWIWGEEAAPCSKCMSSCSRRAWDEAKRMNFMFSTWDLADMVAGMCLVAAYICICPSCVFKNVTKIKLRDFKWMLFSSKEPHYFFNQNNNWIHVPTKQGK